MAEQLTILIIEDNDMARSALVRAFAADPDRYRVLEARALATGIRHARNHKPDCVLLDFGLPDSAGIQTLRQYLQTFPDAAVVAITGDRSLAEQAMAEGALDFIGKPFDPAEVVRRAELAASHCQVNPHCQSFRSNYESLRATLDERSRRDSDPVTSQPRLAMT